MYDKACEDLAISFLADTNNFIDLTEDEQKKHITELATAIQVEIESHIEWYHLDDLEERK